MLIISDTVIIAYLVAVASDRLVPLLRFMTEGVPRFGVTKVGEVARTTFPEPVVPNRSAAVTSPVAVNDDWTVNPLLKVIPSLIVLGSDTRGAAVITTTGSTVTQTGRKTGTVTQ